MKRILLIYITICWFLASAILMLTPMPVIYSAVQKISYYDKSVHLVVFGVLTILMIMVGISLEKYSHRRVSIAVFIITFFLGSLSEYLQAFIPGRTPSFLDLLADIIGIFLAIFLAYLIFYVERKKILIHVCCGGCAAYIVKLLRLKYKVYLYFCNPNIYPSKEYDLRLKDAKKIARTFGVKLFIADDNHEKWIKNIKGHEKDLEGGERCSICYEYRLKETAKFAKKKKMSLFTTTLTISPHKKADIINKIGENISKKFKVDFLSENFKKKDGYKKSTALSKKLKLYRQNYCGCEFSIRNEE